MDHFDTLLASCRRGDALAWEALVRRFQGRIYGFAIHYLHDREEARDAAQEIFVKVYQHLDGIRDGRTFVPWLLRLARNCCIDRIRGRELRGPEVSSGDYRVADRVCTAASPEEELLAGARASLLYRALFMLNAANREIVLLKDIHQLTLPDISARLGVPLGTVKSRSNRARLQLAKTVRALAAAPGAAS